MSRLVNQLSVDENVAMFLQYGLSEDLEPTINDNVIAREIQQQYQNNFMLDDVAIALEIQRQEACLHDDEGLARTLQDIEGNYSYIPQHDAPSTSRANFHYEDSYHFSGHHTYSSVTSQNGPSNANIDPENMTYEELNELEESIGDVGRGLSQRRISKLPTHKYGTKTNTRCWQIKRKKFVATDTECSICLLEYENGDKITTLPCRHIYHKDCISQWLEQNSVCCVCKAEV